MDNKLYFRRALKVAPGQVSPFDSNMFALVAAFDANLRKLGYALAGDLAVELMKINKNELANLHDEVIATAKEMKGVRRYQPMYPNFPKQVMEASDAELYINAIIHYWSTYTMGTAGLVPDVPKLARPELQFDESKYKIVKLGTSQDYRNLLASLFGSKSAWSETDRSDIVNLSNDDFVSGFHGYNGVNRENKAFLAANVLKRGMGLSGMVFDTATDVLRLAVAMSDGDVSLAENTKFRNFKRAERRMLLKMLDDVSNPVEDMLRYSQQWKRLGEKLHPGEFKQFSTAQAGFEAVRKNGGFKGFNSRVERELAVRDFGVLATLSSRPGEFARRLDHVLRTFPDDSKTILRAFAAVADKVAPTVLLQLRNQMLNRDGKRVFFPKGSVAKMQVIEDNRNKLSEELRLEVARICSEALISQFRDRDKLGRVYIDESLRKIAIPFGQRSASGGVKTLGRGSRLPIAEDTNVLRFFIWWKNNGRQTDIDLSAVVLTNDYGSLFDITYYNLREGGAVHSGDITNAPNGASEFIDIDIERIKERGGRYVAMTLHSYSGQTFNEMPEVFAGFMERADLGSGEVYEPKTVVNKIDVMANARSATPIIFDLVTGEAIWVDLTKRVQGFGANVWNSKKTIVNVVEAMVGLTPPNLYDLFTMHTVARGELVKTREEADVVFALDGDVTPFDSEDILANYL